jgi:hypothetical protein
MRTRTNVITAVGLLLAVICPSAYGAIDWQLTRLHEHRRDNFRNSRTCTSDG